MIRTVAGLVLPVRCSNGFGLTIGSCSYNDFCKDFLEPVNGLLVSWETDNSCPFDFPIKSIDRSFSFEIYDLSTTVFSFLAARVFDVTISVNTTSNQHIACFRFKYTIQKAYSLNINFI